MRQHLHGLLMLKKIFKVVLDNNANSSLCVLYRCKPLAKSAQDCGKSVLLDQVEQALLRTEVVVHAGQRHLGGTGKIAHGSAFISFFAEDLGCVIANLAQLRAKIWLKRTHSPGGLDAG